MTDKGRAFQARAAATRKARSPSVERRVDGTISVDVAADRRRRRTWTSADLWSVSARYCGAVPLRQRYDSLYVEAAMRDALGGYSKGFQNRRQSDQQPVICR